ncbi:hypothetical protein NDK47_04920 [Brevibacillus ruminantium]|uniref:Uncharacterized protein n=1 Tax=Brevibacillus ruminantium TaxID=2950604 RepID=A0ABY4WIM3_9BACL|nr:hypothetical protein [Brevibacillus ruminantium]USG66646.1 hypothetical protein NDK47_04920 [Brevibacillus ruminantium]
MRREASLFIASAIALCTLSSVAAGLEAGKKPSNPSQAESEYAAYKVAKQKQ